MKLRITAVALSIGLTSTAVPMRSLAISEVTNIEVATQTNDDLITEFIVERLPGRSSLGAMSLIENEFDLEATVESKIFDRLEVIQLDQPITGLLCTGTCQMFRNLGIIDMAGQTIGTQQITIALFNLIHLKNRCYITITAKGLGKH